MRLSDEQLSALWAHAANWRTFRGITSGETWDAIIAALDELAELRNRFARTADGKCVAVGDFVWFPGVETVWRVCGSGLTAGDDESGAPVDECYSTKALADAANNPAPQPLTTPKPAVN